LGLRYTDNVFFFTPVDIEQLEEYKAIEDDESEQIMLEEKSII